MSRVIPQGKSPAVVTQNPPRTSTGRQPVMGMVADYLQAQPAAAESTNQSLWCDVVARWRLGESRYGVALTAGNGRDNLVDAYQEALDLLAYLAAELDELGDPVGSGRQVGRVSAQAHVLRLLFERTVETARMLRVVLSERGWP